MTIESPRMLEQADALSLGIFLTILRYLVLFAKMIGKLVAAGVTKVSRERKHTSKSSAPSV